MTAKDADLLTFNNLFKNNRIVAILIRLFCRYISRCTPFRLYRRTEITTRNINGNRISCTSNNNSSTIFSSNITTINDQRYRTIPTIQIDRCISLTRGSISPFSSIPITPRSNSTTMNLNGTIVSRNTTSSSSYKTVINNDFARMRQINSKVCSRNQQSV